MVINPLLASGLQDCIGGAWLQGIYSDFSLEVEGTTFKCHRFILTACSEFFKCMLNSDMKESLQNSATIGDIDKDTMSTVLSALYTGVDGLNQDNIYEVWRAVHQLQITHMVKCCEDFAMNNISKENYFDVLQQAKLLKSNAVLDFVEKFVVKNFEEISKTETFLELSPDEMYNVLQSNELNVHSENTVLESILIWCKHDPNSDNLPKCLETDKEKTCGEASSMKDDGTGRKENDTLPSNNTPKTIGVATAEDNAVKDMNQQNGGRSKHMKRLLCAVRLYLVSPHCLQKILCHFTSMPCTDACQLLIDAIMYQLEVKRRHFAWPLHAIHRTSSDKEHVMVFWSNNKNLQAYRFDSNTVCRICPGNSFSYDTFEGLCVYDNTLLIGYHYRNQSNGDTSSFTKMLTDEKRWEDVSRVSNRYSMSLLLSAHGQSLYQLRSSSLERLNLETGLSKEWKSCQYLSRSFSCAKVTVFRDSLIIFDRESSHQHILWVDLNTMTETKIELDIQDIVSFGNQEETYIIQKNGALRKIVSPNAQELKFQFITQIWDGDWKLRGALLFRGRLFVFGKDLPKEANSQILVPSLAGVYESTELVNVDTDFSCCPIVMSKSWLESR